MEPEKEEAPRNWRTYFTGQVRSGVAPGSTAGGQNSAPDLCSPHQNLLLTTSLVGLIAARSVDQTLYYRISFAYAVRRERR